MSTIKKEDIEKRKAELEENRKQALAQLNSIIGAIADCDQWLEYIEQAEQEKEEEKKSSGSKGTKNKSK